MRCVSAAEWSEHQLPLSLFVNIVEQLQRSPVDEKDAKWRTSWLLFNDFLHRYCVEEHFDGEHMLSFWNEETAGGLKTGGFGIDFVTRICKKYGLKSVRVLIIHKKITSWYSASSATKAHLAAAPPTAPTSASNTTSDHSYLLRRLWKPMILKPTWSHVVEAVRHEMYALMANKMEQASADKDTFDLASQSVDDVIKQLKSKKGGVSGNEIAYIKQLVRRATEEGRPSAPISCEQR